MSCKNNRVSNTPARPRPIRYLAFTFYFLIYVTSHATEYANGEEAGSLGMCTRVDDVREKGALHSPLSSDGLDHHQSIVCSCALATTAESVLRVAIEESSCAAGDNLVLTSGSQTIHLCSASTFKPKQVQTSHSQLQLLWTGRTDGRSHVQLQYEAQPSAPIRIHCKEGKLSKEEYSRLQPPNIQASSPENGESYLSSRSADTGLSLASLRHASQKSPSSSALDEAPESLAGDKLQGKTSDTAPFRSSPKGEEVSNTSNSLTVSNSNSVDDNGLQLSNIKHLEALQKQTQDKSGDHSDGDSTLAESIPLHKLLSVDTATDTASHATDAADATDTKLSYADIKHLLKETTAVTGADDLQLENALLSAVEQTLQNETDSLGSLSLSVDSKNGDAAAGAVWEPAAGVAGEPAVGVAGEPAVGVAGESAAEESVDKVVQKQVDSATEVSADGTAEESTNGVVQEQADSVVEEPTNRVVGKFADSVVDGPIDRGTEESADRVIKEQADKEVDEPAFARLPHARLDNDDIADAVGLIIGAGQKFENNTLTSSDGYEQQSTLHVDSQPVEFDLNVDSNTAADDANTTTEHISSTTEVKGTTTKSISSIAEGLSTTTTERTRGSLTSAKDGSTTTEASATAPSNSLKTIQHKTAPPSDATNGSKLNSFLNDLSAVGLKGGAMDKHIVANSDETPSVLMSTSDDDVTTPPATIITESALSTDSSSINSTPSYDSSSTESSSTSSSTPWWSKFKKDVYVYSHSPVTHKPLTTDNTNKAYRSTNTTTTVKEQLPEVNAKKNKTEQPKAATRISRPVFSNNTGKQKMQENQQSTRKMENAKISDKTGKQLGKFTAASGASGKVANSDVHGPVHVTMKKTVAGMVRQTTDGSDKRQASRTHVTNDLPVVRVTDRHLSHTTPPPSTVTRKNNRQASQAKPPKAYSLEANLKHTRLASDDKDGDKIPFNTTLIAGGTAAGVLTIVVATIIVAVVRRRRQPMRPAAGRVRPGVQKLRSIAAQFS